MKKNNKVSVRRKIVKRKKKVNPFDRAISSFILNIESLEASMPMVIDSLEDSFKKEDKNLLDFFKKFKQKKSKNRLAKSTITIDDVADFERIKNLINKLLSANIARKSIPRSMFILMVSYYDNLLRDLIGIMLDICPEILSNSEKTIPISDLFKNEDLKSLKGEIVEREIDSILRGSHTDHVEWFEKKLKIKLRGDKELWEKFIEITERRNILVHSDGVISEQYMSICKKNETESKEKIKKGDRINLDVKYFRESLDIVFEFGVKLSHVVWRKMESKDNTLSDGDLNGIAYDLLTKNKNELANRLLDFTNIPSFKPSSEEIRLYFVINRAIALREMGNKEEAKKIVLANDLTASADKFKLAAAVILEEHDEAEKIMKRMGSGEDMKYGYKFWPLFNEFRKTKVFLDTYKFIFKEKFTLGDDIEKLKCEMTAEKSNC